MKYRLILPVFIMALLAGGLIMVKSSESKVEISGPSGNEIVVTIEDDGEVNPALAAADELRKQYKLDDAIQSYKDILADKTASARTKQEAEYNMGLTYYWKDRPVAEEIFTSLIARYPDDKEMIAYCELCLALIDDQKEKHTEAIDRLQGLLDNKKCNDEELYAQVKYQIGRINSRF